MRCLVAYMLPEPLQSRHVELSNELATRFKLEPVSNRIDPHCTLKAPFNSTDPDQYETLTTTLAAFADKEHPVPLQFGGFKTFNGKVIYLNVTAPKQTHMLIRRLQDQLRDISWITFSRLEFPVTLHATLAYCKHPQQSKEILSYLIKHDPLEAEAMLDNLTLLKREERRWEREYQFSMV